jgi:hypothetical protein
MSRIIESSMTKDKNTILDMVSQVRRELLLDIKPALKGVRKTQGSQKSPQNNKKCQLTWVIAL